MTQRRQEDREEPRGVQFDKRITVGNLLTIATMTVSLFVFFSNIERHIVALETKMEFVLNALGAGKPRIFPNVMPTSNPLADK